MKRNLITLVLIVLVTTANAQFSTGVHVGASAKGAVIGFHLQYAIKHIILGANMTSHTDNENPAMFQARLGYSFGIGPWKDEYGTRYVRLQPYTGYSYNLTTVDRKDGATNSIVGGVMIRCYISDRTVWYVDVNMNNDHSYVTTGLAFVF